MRHSKLVTVFVSLLGLALTVPAVCLGQVQPAATKTKINALYSCKGKEKLVIEKNTFNVTKDVLVYAREKCTVVIKKAVINAPMVVDAADSARVKLKDCTINVSKTAVRAADSSFVEMEDVVINGPEGIVASGKARVELEDATLNAATAIMATGRSIVTLDDAMVTGKKVTKDKAKIVDEEEEDD
jgi:hypothetical protein